MGVSIDHKVIDSLVIVDRNDVVKGTATGNIRLEGGVGFTVARDDEGAFNISGDISSGADLPYYKAKYNALVHGGGLLPDYTFTGMPYYIASINGKGPHPYDGHMSLLGGACSQIGLFLSGSHASTSPATLEVFDMCTADVDCEDYYRMFTYLKRINDFTDSNKDNNLVTGTQLFKQYEASVHYWNYMVNSMSLLFSVTEVTAGMLISAGYRCMDCGPFSGVSYSVTIVPVSTQPSLTISYLSASSNTNRTDLRVNFSSGASTFTGTADNDMRMRDYIVTNTMFRMTTTDSPPPSGHNIFNITSTWTNTAFGASVTRTKQLITEYVTP